MLISALLGRYYFKIEYQKQTNRGKVFKVFPQLIRIPNSHSGI